MNLYFECKNDCNIVEYSPHKAYCYVSNTLKVVACPFCDVSTSSGEVIELTDGRNCLMYKCFTCKKTAFAEVPAKTISREEVEKLHPHCSIHTNMTYYYVELYNISSLMGSALMNFFIKKGITIDDACAFYKNSAKNSRSNNIISDYNINYISDTKIGEYLELAINDYSISDIPIDGAVYVIFTNKRSILTYVDLSF